MKPLSSPPKCRICDMPLQPGEGRGEPVKWCPTCRKEDTLWYIVSPWVWAGIGWAIILVILNWVGWRDNDDRGGLILLSICAWIVLTILAGPCVNYAREDIRIERAAGRFNERVRLYEQKHKNED